MTVLYEDVLMFWPNVWYQPPILLVENLSQLVLTEV